MAVQILDSVFTYTGNGPSSKVYPVSFPFQSHNEVKVAIKAPDSITPQLLTEEADYTLTIFKNSNNVITDGEITTKVVYDNSIIIFIYREVALSQLTELPEFGPFPASALEMSLDKAVMALQQQERAIRRCFRVTDFSTELTAPYPIPNTVLGLGSDNDLHLFTGTELLSMIQLPGSHINAPTAFWINESDRSNKVPDFIGQLGVQIDERVIYQAIGTDAGDWSVIVSNEADMASNDTKRPPSQASVKAFVEARDSLLKTYADTAAENSETAANSYTDAGLITKQSLNHTLCRFTPRDNQPPSVAWARVSTRNSISTLRFNESVAEYAIFTNILPHGLNFSSLEVKLFWSAALATTGSVAWHANLERCSNINVDAWQSGSISTTTTAATSGIVNVTTLTPTVTTLQAGDLFRLRVFRDAALAGDTMTGDAELIAVEIRRVL